MPDPTFATVSASQIPDLLNISNWGTRLTLHHQFKNRVFEDRKQSVRMKIGKLFEALILELTAEKLALDVRQNPEQIYIRHPTLPLGCTTDADVMCPTRGYGIVESKAIDKYEWQRSWTESSPPKMYLAQHQEQMMIPHPEHGMPTWGIVACFIYNEGQDGRLILYERRPVKAAQDRIAAEAISFFADLEADREPKPFGLPVELDLVNDLYPEIDPIVVINEPENREMAELARMLAWAGEQRKSFERTENELKPKLLHFLKDAGIANLAGGVVVKCKKPQMAGQIVMLPASIRKGLRDTMAYVAAMEGFPDAMLQPIQDALDWAQVIRNPGNQNRLKIIEDATAPREPDPEDEPLMPVEA